jgi:aspartyl-tRNA(Asn)/glutamyl-tRNA(Gln) amidotransferase subunit A
MVEESLRTHRVIGLYPDRATEYGEDVRQRITLAEKVSQQAYADAQRERIQIADAMRRMFGDIDIIVSLCAGDKVPKIASLFPPTDDTAHEYDIRRVVLGYTALQNLTGLPACAVRAGFDGDGLPLAVQFTGADGSANAVLDIAQHFYDATIEIQSQWPAC